MADVGDFIGMMRERGLSPPEYIEPGRIHRFPGMDKGTRNRAGWCRLFEDMRGGVFGDYANGLREVWQSGKGANLHSIQRPARKPPPPEPSEYAARLWQAAGGDVGAHPYAINKDIGWPAGARRGRVSGRVVGKDSDCIVVPIRCVQTGQLFAVQAINPDGAKQTFGPLKGHGLLLGNVLDKALPWYVAEGWATAVSMIFHHHQGNAACGVAFGQSNMRTLAEVIAKTHAPARVVILRERDA